MVPRIYQAAPLAEKNRFKLDEKASHHLARVLRAAVSDELILFNGEGGEFNAVITQIDKRHVEVDILSFNPREAESPLEIYLAQGIARGEKMDFIVQKAVELGVTKLYPLITERCNVRLSSEREEKRLAHWQSIVISACEQSGRNRLPVLFQPMTLSDWLAQIEADRRFVLSPHVGEKLSNGAQGGSVAILIGPEGGLSENEMKEAYRFHFLPLNLGPRVLRTETATLAAITCLQSHFGDMK